MTESLDLDALRIGCCATWPKPCSYHEGWQDGIDFVDDELTAARKVVEAAREWMAAEKDLVGVDGLRPGADISARLHRRRLAVHGLLDSLDTLTASPHDQ